MIKATVRAFLVVGAVALGAFAAKPVVAADDGKCKLATKGDSEVAKACAEGGVKKAKATMKDMLKRAKAAGTKMECDDCHKEDDFSQLTPEGAEKFKKLVAAIAKK